MSPTVFRFKDYRFFFFSREESRIHVHITSPKGEAKFWLEPTTSLADFEGFKERELRQLQILVDSRKHEIIKAWKKHFKS